MSVSEHFDRKFNKSMRGYNTEEVDAAIDALLRYCDELEDANREFEIANNDLIDAKTELNKNLQNFENENDSLKKQLSEMGENLARIESVYNGYREKFGEARDLVTGAKASASEIIARANAKAEIIAEEEAKKRSAMIAELDAEIDKRRELIEKLDISYNRFNSSLLTELRQMIDRVESFAVMPILPEGLPEKAEREESTPISTIPQKEEMVFASEEDAQEDMPKQTKEEEKSEESMEAVAAAQSPLEIKNDFIPLGPVWRENPKKAGPSELSKIKNTLNDLNQKVIEKKSTPYI